MSDEKKKKSETRAVPMKESVQITSMEKIKADMEKRRTGTGDTAKKD